MERNCKSSNLKEVIKIEWIEPKIILGKDCEADKKYIDNPRRVAMIELNALPERERLVAEKTRSIAEADAKIAEYDARIVLEEAREIKIVR